MGYDAGERTRIMGRFVEQVRTLLFYVPGATATDEMILYRVACEPGPNMTELAERTGFPKGTMSRVVFALSDEDESGAGLLTYARSDRRAKRVILAPPGEEFVEALARVFRDPQRSPSLPPRP